MIMRRRGIGNGALAIAPDAPTFAPLPPCAAGAVGSVGALFSAGAKEGLQMWSNPIAAPVFGLMSIGLPQSIQHLSDGTACQPPAYGVDALAQGFGRALVTVVPVLFALWWFFGGKR